MVVAHNLLAQNSNRMLKLTGTNLAKVTEKLSSGYRINRAADDAAGLAISEKMRTQIRGLNRASKNALDGISLIQTAEGGLNEMQSMLHRINELATQAANDTNTETDRYHIQEEINQLVVEIDDTSLKTQFNTMPILSGANPRVLDAEGKPTKGKITYEDAGPAFNGAFYSDAGATAKVDENGYVDIGVDTYNRQGFIYPYMMPPGSLSQSLEESLSNTNFTETNLKYKDPNTGDVKIYSVIGDVEAANPALPSLSRSGVESAMQFVYNTVGAGTQIYPDTNSLVLAAMAEHGEGTKSANIVTDANGKQVLRMQAFGDVNDPFELKLQVGALAGQYIDVSIDHLNAKGLEINGLNVLNFEKAGDAMKRAQDAIDKVSTARASLGAQQNRLEHTIANLDNIAENTQAAESRIRDTDMANAMVDYTKLQILQQAGQTILAQANTSQQGVLALLG